MAILTTYLHHLHDFIKENGDNTYPGSLPHLCTTIRGGNGCVRNEGASMITGSKFPQLGALWGAGLSFGKCHAEKRVPIDSHTLWMFDGEEFLRASHLWTYGYDLYSPSELGSVIYHNYSKVPARFENVKVDYNQKEIETEMGVNRFFLIVNKPFKGRVDTFEMDKYKYGTVRTFQEYLNFSGITFEEGKNDTNSCNQLHWVPYSDPSEVEKLVGRGWKLYPNKDVKAPSIDIKAPTMKDPTVIDGETHGAGARGDVLTEDHAVVIDQKLRQAGNGERERQNPPVGTGTVMFFFFIVIFILFAYANDTTWYAITRQFRTKTGAANK
jgi:hypothetical protein